MRHDDRRHGRRRPGGRARRDDDVPRSVRRSTARVTCAATSTRPATPPASAPRRAPRRDHGEPAAARRRGRRGGRGVRRRGAPASSSAPTSWSAPAATSTGSRPPARVSSSSSSSVASRALDDAVSARDAGPPRLRAGLGRPGVLRHGPCARRAVRPRSDLEVHPAPSSVSLAWAAAGHGVGRRRRRVRPRPASGTPPSTPSSGRRRWRCSRRRPTHPRRSGKELLARGCRDRSVVVASRLGEIDEQVVRTDLEGLAEGQLRPAVGGARRRAGEPRRDGPSISWGRDEATFAHRDGMITKAEVRSVVLGKLELPRGGVLWDVGAGSGSVGIEAATIAPGLRVYAVERSAADAARVGDEQRLGRGGRSTSRSWWPRRPRSSAALPDPDRVFVGGGGLDVVEAAWERLRPGGVLVATFVLLDRAVEAFALLGEHVPGPRRPGRGGGRLRVPPGAAQPRVRLLGSSMSEGRRVVVGVGLSSRATATEVRDLVGAALRAHRLALDDVQAIATRTSLAGDPRLQLGLPVVGVADDVLVDRSDLPSARSASRPGWPRPRHSSPAAPRNCSSRCGGRPGSRSHSPWRHERWTGCGDRLPRRRRTW